MHIYTTDVQINQIFLYTGGAASSDSSMIPTETTESKTATPSSSTGWSVRGQSGFSLGSTGKSKSLLQKGRKYRYIYISTNIFIGIRVYVNWLTAYYFPAYVDTYNKYLNVTNISIYL
jgi:hypothetical protein